MLIIKIIIFNLYIIKYYDKYKTIKKNLINNTLFNYFKDNLIIPLKSIERINPKYI